MTKSCAAALLTLACLTLLVAANPAAAQSATTPGTVAVYSTIQSIGVEWPIAGDANHNAAVVVSYRVQGASAWSEALPLVRIDNGNANMLAGSIFFLSPNTAYEVALSLTDPDGGSTSTTVSIATHAVPALPRGGRVLHVAPGTGPGDGSAERPYRSIADAEAAAQPGDTLLLHQGDYGGRIQLTRSGMPGSYIVWLGAGDGDALVGGLDISASHVWLEGVTIRDQTYGILSMNQPQDVVIRRNTFLNNHYAIYLVQKGDGWYIAENTIEGDTPYWTESIDGEGIDLHVSSGHTVTHNRITSVGDGVSEPNANVDITGNDIFDTSDDGIEADNGWANVRMWGNRIHNAVHNGISFQPQIGGPWYILRNQIVGNVEAAFKFRTTDRFMLLHNTIVNWGNAWPGDAMMCCNEDHLLKAIARNNLWVAVQGGQIWGFDTGGVIDWRTDLDYDGFDWGTHPQPFVYAGVAYSDVSSFAAATGLERHGIRISRQSCFETFNVLNPPPSPVPPQVMTLAAGCPAIDAGARLPNIDDDSIGAPDLGAFERGGPLPDYGPRPAPSGALGAAPSSIVAGGSTTLSWSTSGATNVTIVPTVGVVGASGSTSVSPTATTTYTMIVEGAYGVAVAATTVTVNGSSSGDGSPFGGTLASVPGTIEAERFNEGGAGVAYRDMSAGNAGAEFRNTDVDIESTSDAGGGYDVGWVSAGEWLKYTVNVTSTGTYTLEVRVASEGTGGTFHVEVNGVDRTGAMTIPDTFGWQSWTTLTKTGIALSAGAAVVRLVIDSGTSGIVGNFNWLRLSGGGSSNDGTPYGGTPASVPGTIEAERFNDGGANVAYRDLSAGNEGGAFRNTDVDLQATSDTGGGFNVGWIDPGEWLKYTINVTAAGSYSLDARVASSGAGGTFHAEINGQDISGPLTIPDTGGWQTFATLTKSGVSLSAGIQVLRLVMDSSPGGAVGNINWIRLSGSSAPSDGTPYGGTPANVPGTIEAERFNDGGAGVAYRDMSAGNAGGEFRNTDVDIESTSDAGGGYDVGWVSAGEWLKYTVNVTTAGTYALDVRVACEGPGGTFHVEVDGVDRTGAITIPDTFGWQNWTTLTRAGVPLSAGAHVLRLVVDSNTSGIVGNFNWMRVR